ncbi:MAG: UDP-3-O-(3-hydroxymyristoyl)glucosamine N-acyltransferase [Deltaproteobacteria bacterium]|nr:UDP-3-O-(3-hydroxymyristoyl)glucosamine N-acyltransferase [Deltaproteobacteria bacterium]
MLRWHRRPGDAPTLGELVAALGGRLVHCRRSVVVSTLGATDAPDPVSLAPLWHERSVGDVGACRAAVLLADAAFAARVADTAADRGIGLWIHPRPRRAFRGVLERLFEPRAAWDESEPSRAVGGAWVHPQARLGDGVRLAPGAVIGADAELGDGVHVGAGAAVLHDVTIGPHATLGPGCVVGADGFGLDAAPGELSPEPLPHVGRVVLGARVRLGANVVVARGTLGATSIGDDSQLDALVQIGHNVRIGRGCVICAQVGIGGSSVVGDGVWIGGQAGIADHCRVGDRARLAAQSGVIGDVPADETWGGTPAVPHPQWMRGAAVLARLARGREP